jgi:hypothetical protein
LCISSKSMKQRSGYECSVVLEIKLERSRSSSIKPQKTCFIYSIEDILANYRTKLETQRSLTQDEEELMMNLSTAYLKKQEEWKLEGKLEAAIAFLREGATSEFVSKALAMPIEAVEKLKQENISIDVNES